MTREAASLVMIAVALAAVGLMAWGWLRRRRRDAALVAPVGEPPEGSRVLAAFEALYVATTDHDAALERLAVRGLAFRSRARITVTDAGVALDMPRMPRVFVPSDAIAGVDAATVTIDRVVERDGLTRLSWWIEPGRAVDSYLRPMDASARSLTAAIEPLLAGAETRA